MKTLKLKPEEVIVPAEYYLGNNQILKIYFRLFNLGHGNDLPPVIVVNNEIVSEIRQERLEKCINFYKGWGKHRNLEEKACKHIEERKDNYKRFNEIVAKAPYYLIDGNHRSTAATLTHNPIYAIELQSDEDVYEIKNMIKKGDLFDFDRSENSLISLASAFEEYIIGNDAGDWGKGLDKCMTVKERVDKLTSNGDLPGYMKMRYKKCLTL